MKPDEVEPVLRSSIPEQFQSVGHIITGYRLRWTKCYVVMRISIEGTDGRKGTLTYPVKYRSARAARTHYKKVVQKRTVVHLTELTSGKRWIHIL